METSYGHLDMLLEWCLSTPGGKHIHFYVPDYKTLWKEDGCITTQKQTEEIYMYSSLLSKANQGMYLGKSLRLHTCMSARNEHRFCEIHLQPQ